jgi:hypothetical protein
VQVVEWPKGSALAMMLWQGEKLDHNITCGSGTHCPLSWEGDPEPSCDHQTCQGSSNVQ